MVRRFQRVWRVCMVWSGIAWAVWLVRSFWVQLGWEFWGIWIKLVQRNFRVERPRSPRRIWNFIVERNFWLQRHFGFQRVFGLQRDVGHQFVERRERVQLDVWSYWRQWMVWSIRGFRLERGIGCLWDERLLWSQRIFWMERS